MKRIILMIAISILAINGSYARFYSVDPKWEQQMAWTPYHYCENNPVNASDPTGEIPNKTELGYFAYHPIDSYKGKINADKAEGASKFLAEQKDKNGISYDGASNGRVDAFRHAYWSALNSRDFGFEKAKDFGDNHENVVQPEGEKKMDLFNNWQGYIIGQKFKDASDENIFNAVKNALDSGILLIEPTEEGSETKTNYLY